MTACAGTAGSKGLLRPLMQHGGQGRFAVRAIKTINISILALGLLAGSAVGVAAQDEASDPVVPPTFTWSYGDVEGSIRGYPEISQGFTVVASDPRASGEMTNDPVDEDFDEPTLIGLWESRLVNDDGSWVGIGKQVIGFTNDLGLDFSWEAGLAGWEMTGEGAYEGLSLILFDPYVYLIDYRQQTPFGTHSNPWGVIYPSEPPAE